MNRTYYFGKKWVKNELTQKKKLFGSKYFLTPQSYVVQFVFENNKKLMMKIEIERGRK